MFPGGRRNDKETERDCIRREIKEELPKLKLGRLQLWKEITAKNNISGRQMSDAVFIAKSAKGRLDIGDKKELDRAVWQKPRGVRLTPTSRYILHRLFSRQYPTAGVGDWQGPSVVMNRRRGETMATLTRLPARELIQEPVDHADAGPDCLMKELRVWRARMRAGRSQLFSALHLSAQVSEFPSRDVNP